MQIATARSRAIAERPPRWPFAIEWDSPLAQGLSFAAPMVDGLVHDLCEGVVTRNIYSASVAGRRDNHFHRRGYDFNGSSSFAFWRGGKLPDTTSDSVTLAAWTTFDSPTTGETILSLGSSSVSNRFLSIMHRGSDDKLIARYYDGSAADSLAPSATTAAGRLYHVAGSFRAKAGRTVYVDGVGHGEGVNAQANVTIDQVAVGSTSDSTPGTFLDGTASWPMIWMRQLSDAEHAALYDPALRWQIFRELGRSFAVVVPVGGGPGGFTTALATKTIAENAQITGLVSALDALGVLTHDQITGLVTGLDALTLTEYPATLGGVGALTTVLDALSVSGQAQALGLISTLDALSITERAQVLGFVTATDQRSLQTWPVNIGGSSLTTALAELTITANAAGLTPWALGAAIEQAYDDLDAFFDLGGFGLADLDTYVDAEMGFGETMTVAGDEIAGIFDDHSWDGGERGGPKVTVKTSDIDSLSIDHGTQVEVRGRTFTVAAIRLSGVGTTELVLVEPV